MEQAKVLIHHESGLHARPAAQFVKLAKQFSSNITVSNKGKTVNAKSTVLILTLGVDKGSEIEIAADGDDEKQAVASLVSLIENNFSDGR